MVHDTAAIPCPFNAEGLRQAFVLYSSGLYSDEAIAEQLNAAGYRTSGHLGRNRFGKDTVRDMLQSRFYIGETSYKGGAVGTRMAGSVVIIAPSSPASFTTAARK